VTEKCDKYGPMCYVSMLWVYTAAQLIFLI